MRLIDADRINFYKATVARGMHSFENVEIVEKFQIDRMLTIDPEILRPRWIPVTERLPDTEDPVLAYCKYGTCKGGYVCSAFYVAPGTYEEDSDFSWDYEALGDYNEEKDSYEIPAGWYERIHNWDDYGSVRIYGNVTHWMPLPEPPESEGENG